MSDGHDYYRALSHMVKAVASARDIPDDLFVQCKNEAGFEVIAILPPGHVVVLNQMTVAEMNWMSWKMHEILWTKLFGVVMALPLDEPKEGRPAGKIGRALDLNATTYGPVLKVFDDVTQQHYNFSEYLDLRDARVSSASI